MLSWTSVQNCSLLCRLVARRKLVRCWCSAWGQSFLSNNVVARYIFLLHDLGNYGHPPLFADRRTFYLLVVGRERCEFKMPQRVVPPFGGMVSPSVFEICLRDQDLDDRFAVCGEVFSGFSDNREKAYIGHAKVLDRMVVGDVQVICFRHSLAEQKMTLFLNGRKRSEADAQDPIAITSRKILGRHPILATEQGIFRGDIGELLLFNRALSDSEIKVLSVYLCDRFGVAVEKD